MQGEPSGYAVIIDRISQDVPFYRTWLKNAAVTGTAVINNPFWWSADDKYFNNCLMTNWMCRFLKQRSSLPGICRLILRMIHSATWHFPLDWDTIFNYVGFPAYMKPFAGGGWKHVYKLDSAEDFFNKHSETGQLVMLLQEEIVFTEYYRCYCIGGKYVRIMSYEPRNPHHLRYVADFKPSPERLKQMTDIVLRINKYLGYDFNTVELALEIMFLMPLIFAIRLLMPKETSVGEENFEWVVETAANYAIEKALANKEERR